MEQRYEYTTIDNSRKAEAKINELAEDGWQFVETLEFSGATNRLVFERPVE